MITITSLTFLAFLPSTPNTHLVDQNREAKILRGGAPRNTEELKSLIDFGIKKIIIFKNETKDEVRKEIKGLTNLDFPREDIVSIPMPWRDFHNFEKQCEMTIQAMQEIEQALADNESLFFHCTVGEDRTGYLAALWRVWKNPMLGKEHLFINEMCARGYEGMNPHKPKHFVDKIRAYMTPLYLSMFDLIREASLKGVPLKQIKCPNREFIPDFETPYVCL